MSSLLKYRADVDGLRAVAVLAVVVFHAWPEVLPGGFVGVDVFFVLSGYLISGIVFKGCAARTFTFADFYARRVRRIFPSLVAMLALALAYGWLVLFPAELRQLGSHAAWGGVFLQNVAFWLESGYFDTSAALKPLLHLWSLAVEEQVYLVFPPVVLLAWRFRWPMLPLLAGLLVLSLAACLVATSREPSAAFFLTPFRAWEFLAGSILAWIHDRRGAPTERSWRAEVASWSGLALLGFGLTWIGEGEGFPGWRAAIPVTGTTLVLAAGTGATANRWILALKPLVWVGLISYPLYLFHWPLLSFLHVLKGPKPDAGLVWGAVGLSVALAAAAYYGLERPIRPSRWRGTVPTLLAAFGALGAVGLGVSAGVVPARPLSDGARLVNDAIAEQAVQWRDYSEGYRTRSISGAWVWTTGVEPPQVLCVGDSTIMMLAPRVRKLVDEGNPEGGGAVLVVGGGLCPIPGAFHPTKPAQRDLMQALEEELLANPSIERVVISGLWNYFFSRWTPWTIASDSLGAPAGRDKAMASLASLIERLEKSGKRVFVVLPVPNDPRLDPRQMYSRELFGGGTLQWQPVTVTECHARSLATHVEALAAAVVASGAELIDPMPALSRDGTCIAVDEHGPIRSDHMHLRAAFARDHATYVDPAVLGAPEAATAEAFKHEAPSESPRGEVASPPEPDVEATRRDLRLGTIGGATATLARAPDGSIRIEIQKLSGGPAWHVQLVGDSVAVEAGARYAVSLRARADAPRPIVLLAVEGPPGSAPLGLARDLALDAEWRRFRFEFVATKDDPAARLRLNLGASDVAVEIDGVTFVKAEAHNPRHRDAR